MPACGIIQKLREDYVQLNPEKYDPVITNLIQASSLINLGNSELEMGFPIEKKNVKMTREIIECLRNDLDRVSDNYKTMVENNESN